MKRLLLPGISTGEHTDFQVLQDLQVQVQVQLTTEFNPTEVLVRVTTKTKTH